MHPTRSNPQPARSALLRVVAACLFACGSLAIAAPPSQITRVEILNVQPSGTDPADHLVTLRIELRAGNRQLVIPYCGKSSTDVPIPCNARLLTRRGRSWRPAKAATGIVIGAQSPDTANTIALQPGDHASFQFSFSTRLFGIQPGQKLRLQMSVRSSPQVLTGTPLLTPPNPSSHLDTVLRSPTFQYPPK